LFEIPVQEVSLCISTYLLCDSIKFHCV
jgi:hypothetical protein